MTTPQINRFTAQAHKSYNPDEVHFFVQDSTDDKRYGWFTHVENAQAAATRCNRIASVTPEKIQSYTQS